MDIYAPFQFVPWVVNVSTRRFRPPGHATRRALTRCRTRCHSLSHSLSARSASRLRRAGCPQRSRTATSTRWLARGTPQSRQRARGSAGWSTTARQAGSPANSAFRSWKRRLEERARSQNVRDTPVETRLGRALRSALAGRHPGHATDQRALVARIAAQLWSGPPIHRRCGGGQQYERRLCYLRRVLGRLVVPHLRERHGRVVHAVGTVSHVYVTDDLWVMCNGYMCMCSDLLSLLVMLNNARETLTWQFGNE